MTADRVRELTSGMYSLNEVRWMFGLPPRKNVRLRHELAGRPLVPYAMWVDKEYRRQQAEKGLPVPT